MTLTMRDRAKAFSGEVIFYEHPSSTTKTPMRFGTFTPSGPIKKVLIWLSGLTCTDENFLTKGGALKAANDLGIALIAPDTSPRGLNLPAEHDSWDFGSGAGFYLDATMAPWKDHYLMESYVTKELIAILKESFGYAKPFALSGHSMGGHGALTLGIKNPDLFSSISAFAPITAPSKVPWGQKAFSQYLGDDEESWQAYDACALVARLGYNRKILVDQGDQDAALKTQLRPDLFMQACKNACVDLNLRFQKGYDHGYFFVSTFMADHLRFHLEAS